MKYRLLLLLIVFVSFSVVTFSQFNGSGSSPILVKGTVTDDLTGKPLGVEMLIKDKTGKKFKIKSNSITGEYEQILNGGEKYSVIFTSYEIVRTTDEIHVKTSQKYEEQKLNFTVKRLSEGRELYNLDIFGSGDTDISGPGKNSLNEIKTLLRFNRSVKLEFKISAHDTYVKAIEKKQSKKKKKRKSSKKKNIEPDPEDIKKLVDSRLKMVDTFLDDWKGFKKRITLVPDFTSGTRSSVDNNSLNSTDLKVIVKKLENVLK